MIGSLSVRIPIFNQPEKLYRCLQSVEQQSMLPTRVILFDDKSSKDYQSTISHFNDILSIQYIKNSENLGAVANMLNAMYFPAEEQYIMVLHEDDYLQPSFIEISIQVLENKREAVFSCSNISFFSEYSGIKVKKKTKPEILLLDKNKYIQEILKGKTIGFGTVVYRSSALKKTNFEFDKYSVLGDRPFLAEKINRQKAIYINEDLYAAYDHGQDDMRWLNISEEHVYNLHLYYKKQLTKKQVSQYLSKFTHSIVQLYKLIPLEKRGSPFLFYFKMKRQGLFSFKYFFLMYKTIRKMVELLR